MAERIDDLEFDDWNDAEMVRHRVRFWEVRQVFFDGEPVFVRNKRPHSAPLIMIGPTHGGRFLTVPVAPTARPGVWRPATAWESNAEERAKYYRQRGQRKR